MPPSLEAGLPPMQLTDGYKIVFEARDPTTGNAVSGVKLSAPLMFAEIEGDITISQAYPVAYVQGPTDGTA